MIGIRAHFDGNAIIPDEPVTLSPTAQVVVLLESSNADAMNSLQAATREYYEAQGPRDAEDDDWGELVSKEGASAWDSD
jgi:hypothetical protein